MKKDVNRHFHQIVYLSFRNDKDLIAFYQNTSSKVFVKAIKESLRLAIRPGYQTTFFKEIMPDPSWDIKPIEGQGINVQFTIGEKEEDLRELLLSAKNNRRGMVIKMALRFALGARYVVGNSLNGDNELNPLINKDNMFYIQRSPTKVVYRTQKVKEVVINKEITEEKTAKKTQTEKEEIIQKSDEKGKSSFTLPGLTGSLPITETKEENDDFSDDDILSMLDSM